MLRSLARDTLRLSSSIFCSYFMISLTFFSIKLLILLSYSLFYWFWIESCSFMFLYSPISFSNLCLCSSLLWISASIRLICLATNDLIRLLTSVSMSPWCFIFKRIVYIRHLSNAQKICYFSASVLVLLNSSLICFSSCCMLYLWTSSFSFFLILNSNSALRKPSFLASSFSIKSYILFF